MKHQDHSLDVHDNMGFAKPPETMTKLRKGGAGAANRKHGLVSLNGEKWNGGVSRRVEPTCVEPAAENPLSGCPINLHRQWSPAQEIMLPDTW